MNELYHKIYGCLICGAAGDGGDAGLYGTDTALESLLIRGFLYSRSRPRPGELIKAINELKPDYLRGNELRLRRRLESGQTAGEAEDLFCPAAALLPGLINCAAPELAYSSAFELADVVSAGAVRQSTALYAALLALAMERDATAESLIEGGEYFGQGLRGSVELAEQRIEKNVPLREDELVYAAFALIKRCGKDGEAALSAARALKYGGRTAAILTGHLAGALYGSDFISGERVELIERVNAPFLQKLYSAGRVTRLWDVSDLLFYALRVSCDRDQKRFNTLRKRLGDINGDVRRAGFTYQSLDERHRKERHIRQDKT